MGRRLLAAVALGLVFVLALVVGAVVHLPLPLTRRVVAYHVAPLVSEALPGTVTVGAIEALEPGLIVLRDVGLDAPDGMPVARLGRVRVRPPWHLGLPDGIDVGTLDAETAWVSLAEGGEGLALVEAVVDEAASKDADEGEPTAVALPAIHVQRAVLNPGHGLGPVEVTDLSARLTAGEEVRLAWRLGSAQTQLAEGPAVVVSGSGHLRAAEGLELDAQLDGAIDGAHWHAEGGLVGGRLAASLKVMPVRRSALRSSWRPAELPIGRYALDVRARGPVTSPRFDVAASLTRPDGRASVEVTTEVDFARSEAAAQIAVADLDPGWVAGDFPSGLVGAQLMARIGFADGLDVEVAAAVPATELEGQRVPALDVHARGRGLLAAPSVDASLRARKHAWRASLHHDPAATDARVDAVGFPLGVVPGVAAGEADVRAEARLEASVLTRGRLAVALRKVAAGPVRIERLALNATAEGPLDDPRRLVSHAELEARAGTVDLGLRPVSLTLDGGLGSARVEVETPDAPGRWGGLRSDARLGLSPEGRIDVEGFSFIAGVAVGAPLRVEAERAWYDPSEQGFGVRGLEVRGLSQRPVQIEAIGTVAGAKRLTVKAPSIALPQLARVAPVDLPVMRGTVSLDASLRGRGAYVRGGVRARARAVRVAKSPPVDAEVELELDGREVQLDAEVKTAGAHVDVSTRNLRLGGPPTAPMAWRRPTGHLQLAATVASIDELISRLQEEELFDPLPVEVSGRAELNLLYDRARGEAPEATLGLALSDIGLRTEGWSWSELEIGLSGRLRPGGGTFHVGVDDAQGRWVRGALRMERLGSALMGGDGFAELPLDARVDVEARPLKKLPPVQVEGLAGRVAAKLRLSGSLARPQLLVDAMARRVRLGATLRRPHRLDAHLEVDSQRAELTLRGGSRKRPRTIDADLSLTGPVTRYLRASAPLSAFRLDGEVDLSALPLRPVEGLTGVMLAGKVDGHIEAHGLGGDGGELNARLSGRGLNLAGADGVDLDVSAELVKGRASTELTLGREEGGRLVVEAGAPVRALRPDLEAVELDVRAEAFELDVVQPLVGPVLPVLEGQLDGEVHLQPNDGRLAAKGELELSEGRFQVGGVGEVFEDAEARITLADDGRVVLESLKAQTLEGRLAAEGEAKFDGVVLERAEAAVTIADPIPLLVSGQRVGDAKGRVELAAKMVDAGLVLDVDVPKLEIELPRALPSGVQSLDDTDGVVVGVKDGGRFVQVPMGPPESPEQGSPLPVLVDVSFADVVVRRNRQLWAELSGGPSVEVTDRARVGGTIRIDRGELELQGRTFQIEPSVVNFDGHPPDNPQIIATAHWDAPDGTRVFADYRGPLKKGELTLRSDPPLSRDAIIALLLFGEAGPESEGGAASTAASVGGSVLTEGLNEAISDLTSLDLQANLGNRGGATSTEVELRIARDISIGFSHILGIPSPSAGPDRNFATVQWRFTQRWEVEATVGDAGSAAVDLLWRHRYR